MQFLWIVFSSALDDIKERVSLAAHDVIVVDGSSNANGSEGETSLCTIIAASLFGQILLMSLLMSQCVTCKADTTLPAALTRFFTNPWQQLPLFASMSNYLLCIQTNQRLPCLCAVLIKLLVRSLFT
jgi:hypothetical protein